MASKEEMNRDIDVEARLRLLEASLRFEKEERKKEVDELKQELKEVKNQSDNMQKYLTKVAAIWGGILMGLTAIGFVFTQLSHGAIEKLARLVSLLKE